MKILSGLCEGQVLQRLGKKGAAVILSLDANVKAVVRATLSFRGRVLPGWNNRKVGRSSLGRFSVRLNGIPPGGAYTLKLRAGSEEMQIRSFLVGDVWLLAGQSNMQGSGRMTHAAKPHPLIRAFSLRREWRQAVEPLHMPPESPDACRNEGKQVSREEADIMRREAAVGAGPALYFAREMLARTGVPQGLICAAHGGSSLSQWAPGRRRDQVSLYDSLCASVRATGQPVAGLLWYQGESDALQGEAAQYLRRMKKLVRMVRRDLPQRRLPWIIAQLSRYVGSGDAESWSLIRESQRQLPLMLSDVVMVPTIDLPLDDPIHLGGEGLKILGHRLADAATSLVMRDTKALQPPRLISVSPPKFDGTRAWLQTVRFSSSSGKLRSSGRPQGFSYVDAEHNEVPLIFRISLHGSKIQLHLRERPHGVKLGYGLGLDPICNIMDEAGCSLPAFGPLAFERPVILFPYMERWIVTDPLRDTKSTLPWRCPEIREFPHRLLVGVQGFVSDHERWKSKDGQVFFASTLDLPEAMRLRFFMGYDGPFALWLDGKPFWRDLNGKNPACPDSTFKDAALPQGRYRITVGMNLKGGRTWGFFLRFGRLDGNSKRIPEQPGVRPLYGV